MCIEDGTSAYYNQIIDEEQAQADWNSTDHMLRKDDLYEWGMFVVHNSPQAVNGDGSCIFLHVAEIDGDGTAGGVQQWRNPECWKFYSGWMKLKIPILIQTQNLHRRIPWIV
ncbi:MAG: hypothetical protein R3B93_19570 [Bacteroidia bacterium]